MDTPTDICQLFLSHGLRCTKQRTALYEALSQSRDHPTADQLHQQLTGPDLSMSLATVYNTLEAFCRAGIVQKLPGSVANTSARYDALRDNHLHLRDRCTGELEDIPEHLSQKLLDHLPPQLLAELETHLKCKISRVEIQLVADRS